jgi:DNA polymerase-3 subunit alpha
MKTEEVLQKCKEENWDTIAITNHGNLFNLIDAIDKGKALGIKVIPGMEGYMSWSHPNTSKSSETDERYHIILLAMNQVGYQNLLKIATESYTKGFYHKPRLDYDTLAKYGEGIIATSACIGGKVSSMLFSREYSNDENKKRICTTKYIENHEPELDKVISQFKDILGDRFYLEIQHDSGVPEVLYCAQEILKAAERTNTKVVATADAHYLKKENFDAWITLKALATGGKFGWDSTNNYWLKTRKELEENLPLFAIEETIRLGDRCEQIDIPKEYKFPHIDLSEKTPDEALEELSGVGLSQRILESNSKISDTKLYFDRLRFELDVLKKMGFASYILVVSDYIRWAKAQGIFVGAARGSAAGSIVCWAVNITEVDPIKYGLLFERFINPSRMGDIQIDLKELSFESFIKDILPTIDRELELL